MQNSEITARRDWMSVLAKASAHRLADLMPELPAHDMLRAPEIGSVMVQGRVGGTGVPFNLGEMTVTRCSLRLASGVVGHACVQGRDKGHATRAALADALLQTEAAVQIETSVISPLRDEAGAKREARAARAAATRVEFFTLMRGEDK